MTSRKSRGIRGNPAGWKLMFVTAFPVGNETNVAEMEQNCAVFTWECSFDFYWYSYRVAQNMRPFLYALTSSNINRFSKLFHCQNHAKICNNNTTKDPTTPQVCRYSTM